MADMHRDSNRLGILDILENQNMLSKILFEEVIQIVFRESLKSIALAVATCFKALKFQWTLLLEILATLASQLISTSNR